MKKKFNENFTDDGWYKAENIRLSAFGIPNKWLRDGLKWKLTNKK